MSCLNKIIWLMICLSILSIPNLSEACELNLESNPQSSNYVYNPQDRNTLPQKINLRVRNISEEKCVGELGVKAQGRDNYLTDGSQTLTFRIYGSSNTSQLLLQSNANVQNAIPMIVEAQESASLELFLVIDPLQTVMAGTYVSDLDVRFGSNQFDIRYSFPLRVKATIKPNLQANITGLGTSVLSDANMSRSWSKLELGELIPKKNYRLGLQIRSNTPVGISMNSQNKGFLRHQSEQSELAYGIELNGERLNMEHDNHINGLSSNYNDGRTNPINITLSDFGSNLPAGNYSDVLTFHISAR